LHLGKLYTYEYRECGHKYYAPQEAEECGRRDRVGNYSTMAARSLSLRRFEEALSLYNKALGLCPDEAGFLVGKGMALEGLNRFDDALLCYGKAARIRMSITGRSVKPSAPRLADVSAV